MNRLGNFGQPNPESLNGLLNDLAIMMILRLAHAETARVRTDVLLAEKRFQGYRKIHEQIASSPDSGQEVLNASCEQYTKLLDAWDSAKRRFKSQENLYYIMHRGYSLN